MVFQNLPIKGQMKGYQDHTQPNLKNSRRNKAEAEAMRLLQNKDDMYEKYLKKPSTTSVGFLVLSKINSNSTRQFGSKQMERA